MTAGGIIQWLETHALTYWHMWNKFHNIFVCSALGIGRIWKEAGMMDCKVQFYKHQTRGQILHVAFPNTQQEC